METEGPCYLIMDIELYVLPEVHAGQAVSRDLAFGTFVRRSELYLSKWMVFSKDMKEFKYCEAKSNDEWPTAHTLLNPRLSVGPAFL